MTIVLEAKALQFSNHNSVILCHSVLKFLAESENKKAQHPWPPQNRGAAIWLLARMSAW